MHYLPFYGTILCTKVSHQRNLPAQRKLLLESLIQTALVVVEKHKAVQADIQILWCIYITLEVLVKGFSKTWSYANAVHLAQPVISMEIF